MLSGSDEEYVLTIIKQFRERFDTVDLGDAKFLLGLGIQRNVNAGTILLQDAYAKAVLDKFGMADKHPAKTPAKAGPIFIEEEEILSPDEIKFFRSATGSLLYFSRCTRPDITHSVMVLTRRMSKPRPRAMSKLKRVLRYLKGAVSIGNTYSEDVEDGDKLTAHVDSDVLNFAGGPVGWRFTKKTVVAISTVEAEHVAMSKACAKILHFGTCWNRLMRSRSRQPSCSRITLVQCHLVGALK